MDEIERPNLWRFPETVLCRQALGLVQPRDHAADRYLPASAIYIGRLRRYTPSVVTIDRYRSELRGPNCYDANEQVRLSFEWLLPCFCVSVSLFVSCLRIIADVLQARHTALQQGS